MIMENCMKIVFFKIAWMREYRGNKDGGDEPIYSGMKNMKIEDVHEKYNFTPVRINDEDFCLGFFETKNYRKKVGNQLHIERIQGSELSHREDFLEDVLVVYCANQATYGYTTVVGWYKHATVFRYYQTMDFEERGIQKYNAIARACDCVLLPVKLRSEINVWQVPNTKRGWPFGFGRADVWYASEDDGKLTEYLNRLSSQIENYSGENWIK